VKEFPHFTLRLLVICALCAGGLSLAHQAAAGIQEDKEKERVALLKQALPAAERFETVDQEGIKYEIGYKGTEPVGGIFHTESKGYGGPMQVMVGIDPQGKVVEVILLTHQETLGLWTKQVDQEFRAQFRGKSSPFILKRDTPEGNLDGVTSATVTCRAVIQAVEEALRIFKKEWGKN